MGFNSGFKGLNAVLGTHASGIGFRISL